MKKSAIFFLENSRAVPEPDGLRCNPDITWNSDESSVVPTVIDETEDDGTYRCFEVLYGKLSTRMHKRWLGDGLLFCRKRYVILQTENGDELARANGFSVKHLGELAKGSRLKINTYELEVQAERHSTLSINAANARAENIPNVTTSDNLVKKSTTDGSTVMMEPKRSATRSFVSPIYGRDDPSSDFLLDMLKDNNGCFREVSVDGRIARHLRPHQKYGISFMYRFLKGNNDGFILADEMGLGKSVQTISLITALMKRRQNYEPIVRKCVIVAPTSLINNWYAEFMKWSPQSRALMIARAVSKLSNTLAVIDLLVCDEAHRLKNLHGRLRGQICSLDTKRRLLLTGTPLQNDIEEFFSLVNFARPNLFKTFAEFEYLYKMETTHFNAMLNGMMLRRKIEVNYECLPPKNDYIIWCRASPLQCTIYERLKKFLPYDHLVLIDFLRKLCNHPCLLYQSITSKLESCRPEEKEFYNAVLELFPTTFSRSTVFLADSGKLSVFADLLTSFRIQNAKVIIVSNFTKTLDLLEGLCLNLFYDVLRLDGSTEAKKRMEIVNQFNCSSTTNCAFLLSAKAGGLGLNLIGASRMILFDSDWNPAVDVQAMARIWRQGQKQRCQIYRLITGGTVDEKILQRQIKKSNLSTMVEMIPAESLTHFSDDELHDIFTLREKDECYTHCLLECDCDGCGLLPEELEVDEEISDDSATDCENTEKTASCNNGEGATANVAVLDAEDCADRAATVSVVPDSDSLVHPDTDKQQEDEAENRIQGNDEVALSASIMMGTLMRWRHYSPRHKEQFELLKINADLTYSTLEDVSFIMKLVSNY